MKSVLRPQARGASTAPFKAVSFACALFSFVRRESSRRFAPAPHRAAITAGVALAAALTLALAGCADGDFADAPAQAEASDAADGRASAQVVIVPPLLSDDGSVMPSVPQAEPADPAVRTQAQRYATRAQAAMLDQALGQDMVHVVVDCCGSQAADEAIAIAYGLQAARKLPSSAPFLVYGTELALAAQVADRLEAAGMTRVFLVTQ
jgi:hypothetical protein